MKEKAPVAVVKTTPKTFFDDVKRVMDAANAPDHIINEAEIAIKLNLSWSKFFPSCSTHPYTFDAVMKALLSYGKASRDIFSLENETVVTDIFKGIQANRWKSVLHKYHQKFIPLTEAEWVPISIKRKTIALEKYFGRIEVPKAIIGKNILHLPTIKCVHPETEIFLADGTLITISELVNGIFAEKGFDITEDLDMVTDTDIAVLTWKDGKISSNIAYKVWKTPAPSFLYQIETKTGRKVKVSEEHPFLTPSGWIKAQNLEVGDYIAIPRWLQVKGETQKLPSLNWKDDKSKQHPNSLPLDNQNKTRKVSKDDDTLGITLPEETSPELWEWMGYFLTSGCTQEINDTTEFWFSHENSTIIQRFKELTRQLFNLDVKICKDRQEVTVFFDSKELGKFLQALGLPKNMNNENKLIPRMLFRCPSKEIISFVKSCLDASNNANRNDVHVLTESERFASDLQLLSLRLGMVTFKKQITSGTSTSTGARSRILWKISLHEKDVSRIFKNEQSKNVTREVHGTDMATDSLEPTSEDFTWDQIVKIHRMKSDVRFLYDLSVESTNNFIGNGIILHNTHGHSMMTGALKNAFGLLLRKIRHQAHLVIHEILVDLLMIQKEISKGLFTVTDGTIIGDGPGPRTMIPKEGNILVASADLVAADAIQCVIMGLDPFKVKKLILADKLGLGEMDPSKIEITGDFSDAEELPVYPCNPGQSPVIKANRIMLKTPLRAIAHSHSKLFFIPILGSMWYHDYFWYPLVGKSLIKDFEKNSQWSQLIQHY